MVKVKWSKWELHFAIILIILVFIIYGIDTIIFGEPAEIFHYIMLHLGFIPIDILIVALVAENMIERNEKKQIQDKIDMMMGIFFNEIGYGLLSRIYKIDESDDIVRALKSISTWSDDDFKKHLEEMENKPKTLHPTITNDEMVLFFEDLKEFLNANREFVLEIISNPTLHNRDNFSQLMLSIMHLMEELDFRDDISKSPETDLKHLFGDVNRIYSKLLYEWIRYLASIKKHYPYMLNLAIRTNPFDEDANVILTE